MSLRVLKIILLFSSLGSLIGLFWINSNNNQLMLPEGPRIHNYPERVQPNDLKFILLWSGKSLTPFPGMGIGQRNFVGLKCPVTNCYVTADKNFFDDNDIRHFDYVAFMGRVLDPESLPEKRAPHQRYIYFNMESSSNYPVKDEDFDGFFNWTSTYRLDSEIPIPYLLIKNKRGHKVGPSKEMDWSELIEDDEEVTEIEFENKKKAAAIFVSHCTTYSGRERVFKKLNNLLNKYNHSVDVYGHCGPYECSRDKTDDCNKMLATDYYFYLSFENSFDEDYVTEKLVKALNYNVVPIVYGGANYSRFLPPGSYLNAREIPLPTLAEIMVELMNSPHKYRQFFKWKKHYTYHDSIYKENICNICAAMNDPSLLKTSRVYDNFRRWWNGDANGKVKYAT